MVDSGVCSILFFTSGIEWNVMVGTNHDICDNMKLYSPISRKLQFNFPDNMHMILCC